MPSEFEEAVVKRLTKLIKTTEDIHGIVNGLDELNRNIERQNQNIEKQTGANLELNKNIEKLIKILVEKGSKKK